MNDPKLFDNGENAADFREIIPDQFIITEKELDRDVYEDFLTFLEETDPPADCSDLFRQGGNLSGGGIAISQKKLVLVQLAQRGSAEAYRLVQEYCTRPDPGLEDWSRIALYECRMRMESDLLDEPVGLISTGLGGDGERLRYIFVLAFSDEPLAEEQQQEIREALDSVCRKHRSPVEEAQFRPACLYVQVLVPLDVAVGAVIEESISLLNQGEGEVYHDYLATNVAEPTEEEIEQFLDKL